MQIGKACAGDVITINKNASILEAAKLMRDHELSCLVVIEGTELLKNPVGLLSDNHIVTKVVAENQAIDQLPVSAVMDTHLLILKEDYLVCDVLHLMNSNHVHRGVIIDKAKRIIGLATSDDLFLFLAHEFNELAEITQKQLEA
jgi:predicted transcriptional regulator